MSQTWLKFNTELKAKTAESQISSNMGCPIVNVNAKTGLEDPLAQKTNCWAIVHNDDNDPNLWVFPKPESQYMTGVVDYTEAPYDRDWFQTSEI